MAATYANYLLGENSWQLIARDLVKGVQLPPQIGSSYSDMRPYQEEACSTMQEMGTPFHDAIEAAWKDSFAKERSFVTPLAISATTGHKPVEMTKVGGQEAAAR